jgi:S-DNA-T family DNA segregation ATPase FtsK/SpoIIIE
MFGRQKRRKPRVYRDEPGLEDGPRLKPETKGAIFTILVFVIAFLSILSIFDLAGTLGGWLKISLAYLFGWSDWLFILMLIFLGFILIKSQRHSVKFLTYLGLSLIIMSCSGLLNFFVNEYSFSEITKQGRGGGALGFAVGSIFVKLLGFWGTIIVLLAILFVGIFLAFNTSFKEIVQKAKSLGILKEKILPQDDGEPEEELEDEFQAIAEEPEALEPEETIIEEPEVVEAETDEARTPTKKSPPKKIIVPLELLKRSTSKPDSGDVNENMKRIKKTFENFGIEVTMGEVNVGPTVTQYTLRPADGVKVSQMLTLQNDLSLALAAHPLRMEAPIPGKSLVGVEVPNQTVSVVKLRDILESNEYRRRKNNLQLALGKDVSGKPILANLAGMPHLLIAGSTGSGKSVAINNIILSLIYQNSPSDLKFILIDPKRVELSSFNDTPHLLTPVINDTNKIINALHWVVNEMHGRYQLLQAAGKRNIESYNKVVVVNRLPYIVIIVDEFAALMSLAAKEIEAAVVSLAQLGRAAGIHLILATQRPSVDVITGLIKANITSRIAFAVASSMDSRTIIDTSGADKLLGKGDMLFMTPDSSKLTRIQGAYVSDEEINEVADYLKSQAEPEYNSEVIEKTSGHATLPGFSNDSFDDALVLDAKEIVIKAGKASATLLQRRLRVGYARAARLLDILEEMGVVGQADGAKPREVLVSQNELEENFSSALDEEEVANEEEQGEDDNLEASETKEREAEDLN